MTGPIRVVLADDHAVVRQGLRALVAGEPDMVAVGEAATGEEALAESRRSRPLVLVLDLFLPGRTGFEVMQDLREDAERPRIVILSMHGDEAYVAESLRLGASAYVLKGAPFEHLARAIREAVAGRRYLSPPLSERSVESYLAAASGTGRGGTEALTPREREVLTLVARGLTSAEIAGQLFISRRTVESHRARILQKLGLKGQSELIRYALRWGIVVDRD